MLTSHWDTRNLDRYRAEVVSPFSLIYEGNRFTARLDLGPFGDAGIQREVAIYVNGIPADADPAILAGILPGPWYDTWQPWPLRIHCLDKLHAGYLADVYVSIPYDWGHELIDLADLYD